MFYFRGVFSIGASIAPSKKQRIITGKLKSFSKDEDGIATVWAMFWLIICFSLSGLAIDVTNAWKVHAILQSTADSAALAGAIELQGKGKTNSEIDAEVTKWAVDIAERNMHLSRYGDVLTPEDVILGYWDGTSFTPMDSTNDTLDPANAVRAITRQTGAGTTSSVGTFFLRFVGFDEFQVATSAVAKIFGAKCDYDGLIAAGGVKLSTKQNFLDEYCIHGEEYLDLSSDNYFELGTIASTEFAENCGPSAGHCTNKHNPGIVPAFRTQSIGFSKTINIDSYIDILQNGYSDDSDFYAVNAYVENLLFGNKYEYFDPNGYIPPPAELTTLQWTDTFKPKPNEPLDVSLLDPNKINVIDCGRDGFNLELGQLDKNADPITLDRIVIVGDGCDFVFDSSVNFTNAVIATTATGNHTFTGSSGVLLGLNDNCSLGNEVTLITAGSVNFAAKLSAYDLEIIAADDVHLAAKANSMGEHIGTNVTAGGDIQVTTGHTFHGCEGRTTSVFDAIKSWSLVL